MVEKPNTGSCQLCGKSFARASMGRHLKTCIQSHAQEMPASAKESGQRFHLMIEEPHGKQYWLHVAVPAEAPLSLLDSFLRHIWLECCGHMSAFEIGGRGYSVQPMAEYGEKSMRTKLRQVLEVGQKFSYEYDFGSTTALGLKTVALFEQGPPKRSVQLLARNDPPEVACDACDGQPATVICTACDPIGEGWLCTACADKHECDSEMYLPVVNSPRAGVCAYTG